jgi:hypothetical protein
MSHLTADGGFIYQARANAKQCKAMLSQMGLLVHFSMMQLKKFPYLSEALDPRPSCPAPESRLFKAERGGGGWP